MCHISNRFGNTSNRAQPRCLNAGARASLVGACPPEAIFDYEVDDRANEVLVVKIPNQSDFYE